MAVCAVPVAAGAAAPPTALLGDGGSEAAAHMASVNASPPDRDANGQTFRRLGPGGSVTVELACDPEAQNYLTARLDGSEANRNYLYLVQPDGKTDVLNPVPETRWGDLDHDSDTPPFPGRYYYTTYDLPRSLTAGVTRVRLRVESRGPFSYYGGHAQRPQAGPSKAIYLLAVHTDPVFGTAGDDRLGRPPPTPTAAPSPDGRSADQYLQATTRAAVGRLMTWQVYGDSLDRARAFDPQFPAMLRGAFVTHQDLTRATTDGTFKGRQQWSADQWLDGLTPAAVNYQNWCPMMAVDILANAYVYPSAGQYQHDARTLDRMFAALDFWCLAQGSAGEFAVPETGPNQWRWIGAPTDRTGHRGRGFDWDLQANGVPSLATGFITVYRDITARRDPPELARLAAALDAPVDPDHTGRRVTRRVALAELYARSRDYFAAKGGRNYYDPAARNPTPSQGFNIGTLYALNRGLQLLAESLALGTADRSIPAPCSAWPTAAATDRLPTMLASRLGEMPDGERWFSGQPDGLSYEGGSSRGGFDGNYGVGMQGGLDDLCRLSDGDPVVHAPLVARLRAVLAANAHFYRRESVAGRSTMTTDYVIAARNIYNAVRPSYGIQAYAATVLNDPVARRKARVFADDGRAFLQSVDNGPFTYYQIVDLQALANGYAAIAARDAADPPPPLPMEDGAADFVWSDTDAQCVVVKHAGDKVYVAFNWRRKPWQVNDLARIHLLSPMVRRVINAVGTHQGEVVTLPAAAKDPVGRAPDGTYYDHRAFDVLNAVRFGRYLVLLNVSKSRPFTYNDRGLDGATNLATGRRSVGTTVTVRPRQALVFELAL